MKIANTAELRDIIERLTTQIETPSTAISTKMDATEINNFFESIETAFNTLYEKLRLLQDVHDFTQEYVQSVFAKTEKELKEVNVESDTADQEYRNGKTKACVAVFNNPVSVRDRDGSALYQAEVIGSTVIPGNAIVGKDAPANASVFSTEICYRRSSMPADTYKSFYVLENASDQLPKEKITFFLSSPQECNYIDVSAFNSDIEEINLICSNGDIVNIPVGDMTFPIQEITAIEITLKADKRDKVAMEVSAKTSTFTDTDNKAVVDILDNVWDTYMAQKGDILYVRQSNN